MVKTAFPASFSTTIRWDEPRFDVPVTDDDWRVIATARQVRPSAETWEMTASLVASVDPSTEGRLRLRTSGGELSQEALIVSHVGPVLMGWTLITAWPADPLEPLTFFLEGRRSSGVGGGVMVRRAAVSLVSAPGAGTAITYPPDYNPGTQAPYPPSYSTADPYGV